MKQMKKTNRGWKLVFMLPLAGGLVMTAISAPAQAERLTSVAPSSVASGGTVTAHGQFQTRYIHDRRYHYHLSLSPRRGGSATYLTITHSSATALTATVPGRVAPGSYVLMVDYQRPGEIIPQMSNKIPITITRAITIRPVRPAQRVVETIDIPVISSITPDVVTPGDRLLIKGHGFGRRQQAGGRKNTILFSAPGGWVTIPIQSWSDTMIMTRPINQKPDPRNLNVDLNFYRNNRQVLRKRAFFGFYRPRILGYQPAKVRPGDIVTVNVRDIPPDVLLRTRFGVTLMRGNHPLVRIPFEPSSRRSDNSLVLHIPRNAEGHGLSIALYRKSDSKVISNLLPGLDISRHNWAMLKQDSAPSLCGRNLSVSFSGGSFMRDGRTLSITAKLRSDGPYGPLFNYTPPVLKVVSDSRIDTLINACVLMKDGIRIQFSYPDGSTSNWVPISVRR